MTSVRCRCGRCFRDCFTSSLKLVHLRSPELVHLRSSIHGRPHCSFGKCSFSSISQGSLPFKYCALTLLLFLVPAMGVSMSVLALPLMAALILPLLGSCSSRRPECSECGGPLPICNYMECHECGAEIHNIPNCLAEHERRCW